MLGDIHEYKHRYENIVLLSCEGFFTQVHVTECEIIL